MEAIGTPKELIGKILTLEDRKYVLSLKEYKPKRTLTANSYAWVLIGKIADVLRTSKEEIYMEMLRSYGQSQIITVRSDIDISKIIKYSDKIKNEIHGGSEFTIYKVYTGSSEFDSREMGVFIDGIIHEAESIGVATMTPREIAHLKETWQ